MGNSKAMFNDQDRPNISKWLLSIELKFLKRLKKLLLEYDIKYFS